MSRWPGQTGRRKSHQARGVSAVPPCPASSRLQIRLRLRCAGSTGGFTDGSRWHLYMRHDLGNSRELTPPQGRLSHVCPMPVDPHIPVVTPAPGRGQVTPGTGQPLAARQCG